MRIFISQSKKEVLRKDQRMSDKKQCEEADEWKKMMQEREKLCFLHFRAPNSTVLVAQHLSPDLGQCPNIEVMS